MKKVSVSKQELEILLLISHAIGARGEAFNWAVLNDVSHQLNAWYSVKELGEMIVGEGDNVSIDEAINLILIDTYSIEV